MLVVGGCVSFFVLFVLLKFGLREKKRRKNKDKDEGERRKSSEDIWEKRIKIRYYIRFHC